MEGRRRICSGLIALAMGGLAHADEPAWWSYRDAYRSLVRFEKSALPKHLIQQRLQVQTSTAAADSLRLTLRGKQTQLELPLDAAGQAKVPLLKSAFDDNAVLQVQRGVEDVTFRVRINITPRPDGLYPVAELRQGCEQVLAQQRPNDPSLESKRCVGVTLAFARSETPTVSLRGEPGARLGTVSVGPLYPGEPDRQHPVVALRWDQLGSATHVHSTIPPLVIAAWWE